LTKRKSRARKEPYTPKLPPRGGDHGASTMAATEGTVLEPVGESNPNNIWRRRRQEAIDRLSLTMKQEQAAKRIRNAYCRVEMLTSGGPLKERVDGSPKPDAVVASQVSAQSELEFVMRAVPRDSRAVVEHVCWHNLPITKLPGSQAMHSAVFKAALDMVAIRCGY